MMFRKHRLINEANFKVTQSWRTQAQKVFAFEIASAGEKTLNEIFRMS